MVELALFSIVATRWRYTHFFTNRHSALLCYIRTDCSMTAHNESKSIFIVFNKRVTLSEATEVKTKRPRPS